jgi:maltose-binding protein MalE
MASDSKSRGWVVVVALAIAFIFLNKYLLIGTQAVLGVFLPGSTPLVSQPEKVAAPEPTAYLEATKAPEPTRAVEATLAPAQPVTITIWHRWSDDQLPTFRSIFDEYSRTHPSVMIELIRQDNLVDILPTVLAAGEGPDLVVDSSDYIGKFTPDMLVPLDELGVDWEYMQSNFTDTSIRSVIIGDRFWGIPVAQIGMALITNTAMLGRDYIIPNDLNMFIEMAKKYEQENPGKKFFCNPGLAYKDPYFLAPILFAYGDYGGFVNVDGNVSLSKYETILAADLLPQYMELSIANSEYSNCQNAFINGEVPIWWNGSWVLPWIEQNGIDVEVNGMGRPYMSTEVLMLPVSAKYRGNADVALDVAKYFASSEVQTRLAVTLYRIPTSRAAIQSPEIVQMEGIWGFSKALEVSIPLFSNKFIDLQWSPVQTALTNILDGLQTSEEALNEAQRMLEEQIAGIR